MLYIILYINFVCQGQKCQYMFKKQDIYFLTSYILLSSKPSKTQSF